MKKILGIALVLLLVSCGEKDYLVNINTSYGTMKVLLYDETPLHKQNFIELAQSGEFDSTIFHRVIEDFMIQGGDVHRKNKTQEAENERIPAEIVPGFYHTKGALAAARQGDQVNPKKQSSSCQFYIVDGKSWEGLTLNTGLLNQKMSELLQMPQYGELLQQFQELNARRDFEAMNQLAIENKHLVEKEFDVNLTNNLQTENDELYKSTDGSPHLDTEYTIFGRVVEGLDIIDKIAAVEKRGTVPNKPVYIFMEVEAVSKEEVTEKYGYQYPAAQ